MKEGQLDDKMVQVTNLLSQINRVNQMIHLHEGEAGDADMLAQYKELRMRFLEELKEHLSAFEIEVLLKNQAA